MAVTINTHRKGVEVAWDASATPHKKVTLRFTRGDDVSESLEVPNDGLALVSYPSDFRGTSYVAILNKAGKVVDEGEITIE